MAKRHNKTGRSNGSERFLKIPHYLIYSVAWRELSPVARAAFVEILALYDGQNNGRLVVSARALAERLGRTKSTAAAALVELEDAGFISTKKHGSFESRNRRAAEYALAHLDDDAGHITATKEFMQRGLIPRPNAYRADQHSGPISRTVRSN